MEDKKPTNVPPVVKALRIVLITLLILYGLVFVSSVFFFVTVFSPFVHSHTSHAVFWVEIRVFLEKVLTGPIYFFIGYNIIKLITLISRGEPFSPASPRHIRRIGYAVFSLAVMSAIVNAISEFTSPGVHVSDGVVRILYGGLSMLLLALGFLVIARVLEVGVSLKKDQDLTV